MATQLDTAHILGLGALTAVGGETVTIGSTAYSAVVGEIEERDELTEGGVRQIRGIRFAFPRSAVTTVPTIWSRVTVRSQELQVMTVNQDTAVVEITAGGLAE
jgi:hypothetical protein